MTEFLYHCKGRAKAVAVGQFSFTPDFILPSGVMVEVRDRLTADDRKMFLRLRAQHPQLDVRFVFLQASLPLFKGAEATCADWCLKHGFRYVDGRIPRTWISGTSHEC